jgi:tetratricopeptide (TPR) repeat protein
VTLAPAKHLVEQRRKALIGFRTSWNWAASRFLRRLADAHRHFGNLYSNRREHEIAIRNYSRALALDPMYTQAYLSRGVLYWREIGDQERAIDDLTRVLELNPTWVEAYFNRGIAYKLHGEPEKAATDFECYLAEATDEFWLEATRRQLSELRGELEEAPVDAQPETGDV